MEAISEENETEVAGPPPAPPAPPAPAPAPPTAPAETVPSAVREQANEANDALEADEDHHEQHIAHVEETRDSFRELAQAKVPPAACSTVGLGCTLRVQHVAAGTSRSRCTKARRRQAKSIPRTGAALCSQRVDRPLGV